MKTISVLAAAAFLSIATLAQAHTHLKEATPADKSVVNTAPANVVLKFSEAAKITALTLRREGEVSEEQKLTATPDTASAQVTAALPTLKPGVYTVNWRVVSADGHIMSGKLNFTFDPKATPSASKAPAGEHEHH